MYITDSHFDTQTLQRAIEDNPFSKPAIVVFLDVYGCSKDYLDRDIFCQIRERIEEIVGCPLNLRKRLDKAKMGRFIIWGELSHRQALPQDWQPLNLLISRESFCEESSEDCKQEDDQSEIDKLRKKHDEAQDQIHQYWEKLREYENFCRLLLLGKILPKPSTTNGLESSPIFQIFEGSTSLDELHKSYKKLLQRWHPDLSSMSPKEAAERFDYIKKAYNLLVNNWNSFNPQSLDIPTSRIKKLKSQQLQWSPESFWR